MKYIQVELGGCKIKAEAQPSYPKWVVYFEYDKSAVNAAGVSVIGNAAEWFYQHPGKRISLEGHASPDEFVQEKEGAEVSDPPGKTAKIITEKRADSVLRILVEKGILKSKISTIGYGFSRPDAPGTVIDLAYNRKVDITISEDEDVRSN